MKNLYILIIYRGISQIIHLLLEKFVDFISDIFFIYISNKCRVLYLNI